MNITLSAIIYIIGALFFAGLYKTCKLNSMLLQILCIIVWPVLFIAFLVYFVYSLGKVCGDKLYNS